MTQSFAGHSDGFIAIPHPILDLLLCGDISKRDLSILLLVVQLRHADLSTVGIGKTHAKVCLQSLLSRKLLVQHGTLPEYRLNIPYLATHLEADTGSRLDRLAFLVGRHLGIPSPNGNFIDARLPKKGTPLLPKRELDRYLEGNFEAASGWSFLSSRGKFEKDFVPPIDKYR